MLAANEANDKKAEAEDAIRILIDKLLNEGKITSEESLKLKDAATEIAFTSYTAGYENALFKQED